jgi:hypothetical protein
MGMYLSDGKYSTDCDSSEERRTIQSTASQRIARALARRRML